MILRRILQKAMSTKKYVNLNCRGIQAHISDRAMTSNDGRPNLHNDPQLSRENQLKIMQFSHFLRDILKYMCPTESMHNKRAKNTLNEQQIEIINHNLQEICTHFGVIVDNQDSKIFTQLLNIITNVRQLESVDLQFYDFWKFLIPHFKSDILENINDKHLQYLCKNYALRLPNPTTPEETLIFAHRQKETDIAHKIGEMIVDHTMNIRNDSEIELGRIISLYSNILRNIQNSYKLYSNRMEGIESWEQEEIREVVEWVQQGMTSLSNEICRTPPTPRMVSHITQIFNILSPIDFGGSFHQDLDQWVTQRENIIRAILPVATLRQLAKIYSLFVHAAHWEEVGGAVPTLEVEIRNRLAILMEDRKDIISYMYILDALMLRGLGVVKDQLYNVMTSQLSSYLQGIYDKSIPIRAFYQQKINYLLTLLQYEIPEGVLSPTDQQILPSILDRPIILRTTHISQSEQIIKHILLNQELHFIYNYIPPQFNCTAIDFYIPEINLLLELEGPHHFLPNSLVHLPRYSLKYK